MKYMCVSVHTEFKRIPTCKKDFCRTLVFAKALFYA